MKKKFLIEGMSCSACQARVNKAVSKIDGVYNVNVNLVNNTLDLETETVTDKEIIKAVEDAGYKAKNFEKLNYQKNSKAKLTKLIISIILLVILLYVSMGSMHPFNFPLPTFISMDNPIGFACIQLTLLIPIIILNFNYFSSGFHKLFKLAPNMDSLVALGATAAILYSLYETIRIIIDPSDPNKYHMNLYYEGAAMILTFVSVGKYIEQSSKNKTSNAIEMLLDLAGKETILVTDEGEKIRPVEDIKINDILKIPSGASIPVDGIVIDGSANVNEATITGESSPVFKEKDSILYAGTINEDGILYFKATSNIENSTLAKIASLVEEAASSKAPISRMVDKVSLVFVPAIILISLITFIIWILVSHEFALSFNMAVSVLVISCPCALGLATPIAIMISTGVAAKSHILVKKAESLENLGKINCVVMDKTGTITEGKLTVIEENIFDDKFIDIIYSLEKESTHPLAKAIVNKYENANRLDYINYHNEIGKGIIATIDNITYYCGNAKLIKENTNLEINYDFKKQSSIILADDKHVLGYVLIADKIKDSSIKAIDLFKKNNIKTIMLTGDNKDNALYIQEMVHVDEVKSDVLPDQKSAIIKELQSKYNVLMIGDGVNDSIALKQANIGMAIGAGADIAMEACDVILVKNSLMDAYIAYRLSKKTMLNIKENLFWALIYNCICIPIAAGALYTLGISLTPGFAALAMSLSSVCVCLNALRLYLFNKEVKKMIT